MGDSVRIKYAVLCSEGNEQRIRNVRKLKAEIPELCVVMANRENVFQKHLDLLNVPDEYNGIVILEDDVQLCKHFKERLADVLAGHETEVVSMFESPMSKKQLKSEYRHGKNFFWCQCNYYPKNIARILADHQNLEGFIKYFYEKRNEPWKYPIDTYIAWVLGGLNIHYWMSVPFLVQHLDINSNFEGRSTKRQTKYFIDDLEA